MPANTDESYIPKAQRLAKDALKAGNPPFGLLPELGGSVIKTSTNTTATETDTTAHPELKLARATIRTRFAPVVC